MLDIVNLQTPLMDRIRGPNPYRHARITDDGPDPILRVHLITMMELNCLKKKI